MLMSAAPALRFTIVDRALRRINTRPRPTQSGKPAKQDAWRRWLPLAYVQHKALERAERLGEVHV